MSTCRWLHSDPPGKNELGPNGKISTAKSVRNWAKRISGIARTGGVYPRPNRTSFHFICGRLYKNELRMSYLGVCTIIKFDFALGPGARTPNGYHENL